jgi:vitamin B12 transporter
MRYVFLMAGILGGGMPALAQTALPTFEDQLVVTAALETTARDQVPSRVTVIDADEIEARQSESVAELISTAAGVTVARAGSPGAQTSLFLRGTDSDQTLLLWNGIPLNNPYFGGVNWHFLPADGLERIEVVRGPSSALYGSQAIGGVVQVFTGKRDGVRLRLEGGEDGYRRAGLAAGASLGRVRLDATGHSRRGDGVFENDFFDSDELMARALWTLRPGVSLGLVARANDAETGIPFSGVTPTLSRRIAWEEREVAVPFKAERGKWEVEALLSRTAFDSAFRDPDDPGGFTASDTESTAERGRTVVTWRQDDFWVAAGAEIERLEVTDSSSFGANLDAAHQRTWALFTQASWGRGPVRFDLGVRRDDNDVYGAETSLRGGVVVRLAEGWRARGSYGEAFRAPSLGELFFPFSGNPDLAPETSESWELGLEREAGGWRVGLTGFVNRQRNLIDFDFVTFTNVNVGRAQSRGVEAEAELRRGIWSVQANGTWLDAEDKIAELPLLRRPERAANLIVTARPGAFAYNLEAHWVGERPDVDAVTFSRADNPSFLRLDAAARWQVRPWIAPALRIENLADEEYEEVLGFPSPGRTVIGGVTLDF